MIFKAVFKYIDPIADMIFIYVKTQNLLKSHSLDEILYVVLLYYCLVSASSKDVLSDNVRQFI